MRFIIKYKKVLLLLLSFIGILSSCKQKETMNLKIMSYNIRHGEGMDAVLDISRSAAIIKQQAPDLCGLQEVDNSCLRSDSVDQTAYLATKTQMLGTFGKFMDLETGEYGMSTLTKMPVSSTKILALPNGKYEPRSSIVHQVEIGKGYIIVFANVHFDWIDGEEGEENRLNQAKTLVNYIDELGLPGIITGDFNCTPNSPTMQYFKKQGFVFVDKGDDNLSFQGEGEDKVEIDHVLYRNASGVEFKKKKSMLLVEPVVSDHRPLIVELEVCLN